jgi:hypothetical protein
LEEQAAGDLAIARPALDAANDAVNCLDKNSLTELKSFSKPPAGVDKVTTALLIMIKVDFFYDILTSSLMYFIRARKKISLGKMQKK